MKAVRKLALLPIVLSGKHGVTPWVVTKDQRFVLPIGFDERWDVGIGADGNVLRRTA
jgi:hypothetical protein